jgi:hypothetical protein
MPNYGLYQEKDLALDALAASVDRDALLDAQTETVASHNTQVNSLLGIFAERVTQPQQAVRTGTTARHQPLDENGRPQPIKGGGQYIVGFPLWKGGSAEGWNFWTREQMTVKNFADSLNLMLQADITWMRDQLLAAVFYSGAGFSYANPQTGENFTVYGLANGDTTVYEASGGAATDSHYAFQSDAIDDAHNPFPAIEDDLLEHPTNGNRLVAFVPTGLVSAIELLAAFAPATRDIIRVVPATGDETIEPEFAPALNLPLTRSMTYRGIVGNTHIVQWQNMPANYIVTVAVDAEQKPIGLREYPQASLQGLVNIGEPISRFPYQQNNYVRAAGFGGFNRTAAHVLKIAASYAAPTAYPFPIG